MNHYTIQQWSRYVRQQLSADEQLQYEAHLGSCDQCLERYMQCLDASGEELPELPNSASVTISESVMRQIGKEEALLTEPVEVRQRRPKTPAFFRHPLFHYMVAAVITILLMGTGAFQSLADRIGKAETNVEAAGMLQESSRPSVSHQIMDKTIGMLDAIQPKQDKGGTR
ncbi:hypothetical protein N0M98_07700 [Paenibacillus doosanensis]|uniref:hypothetical protein n=1 Tax=Paenibacillus doosanensis TaxID=1229154 RepID=UPI00217FD46B|nr:hypothetical protein [Paenibacillus doosanensis]MCS7460026.1 hypothetical protein [Paenibacillus doosanensis]